MQAQHVINPASDVRTFVVRRCALKRYTIPRERFYVSGRQPSKDAQGTENFLDGLERIALET
jgi:hypothetical protein